MKPMLGLAVALLIAGCATKPEAPVFITPVPAQVDLPPSNHPCARANWMYARETDAHTRGMMRRVMKLHHCGLNDTW
jgi:hypothetical protein